MTGQAHTGRPRRLLRNLNAKIASIPMILTAVVIFLGGTIWTVIYSFTNSKLLPRAKFVGFDQYERLWDAPRWIVSIQNLAIYGALTLVFSLVMGFVLAALMTRRSASKIPSARSSSRQRRASIGHHSLLRLAGVS